MPITTIDENSALIVVDLQKGIVALPTAHPIAPVINEAKALIDTFRRYQLPVVLVRVIGSAGGRADQARRMGDPPPGFSDFVAELNEQPGDHVVAKKTWGAFTGTDLASYLRERGITQVVIAGVATSIGVESTARQAHELGFHVTLALDAMTDLNADAHLNSITRIFPRLGETGSAREIIELMARTHA